MRSILAVVILFPATGISEIQAQTDYYARLGLTVATNLVRDVVVQEIRIRQSLAPTLAIGASLPVAPTYRVGLEGTLASSGYHSTEGNTERDLGTLRTWSVVLGLDGRIWRRLHWQAGPGLIGYWPTEDQGIFLRGGSIRFLVGAGFDYRLPVSRQWEMTMALRYDFHRFTTEELRARGFSGTQGVQRVAASIGLARAGR